MTDFAKVFNIYSTEANPQQDQQIQDENSSFAEVKRANASTFMISINNLTLSSLYV